MGQPYVVIMAGGKGERLWPLSTPARPKPFLQFGGQSFLQAAVEQVRPLVPLSRILVAANAAHVELVRAQLPELPAENILAEPEPKGTAACLCLAAAVLQRADPAAVLLALPCDQLVEQRDAYRRLLAAGAEIAADGAFVLFGIPPGGPETGYGYIACAEAQEQAFRIARFVEKPDRETAEAMLDAGNSLWNSGLAAFRLDRFWEKVAACLPEYARLFRPLREAAGRPDPRAVNEVYQELAPCNIEVGLFERIPADCLVLPAPFTWLHVGDWGAIGGLLAADADGNGVHARHVGIDTTGSVIVSSDPDRVVATIGLRDIVIVETPGALLVMDRQRAQETRRILALLAEEAVPAGERSGS